MGDAPGVTVDLGGAALRHRPPVDYPQVALRDRIHGEVAVELKVDGTGTVVDERALSGPVVLQQAVLNSAYLWHFRKPNLGSTVKATITFDPYIQAALALLIYDVRLSISRKAGESRR